jgi:ATP-dependent DNA helicase RecQ
MVSAVADDGTDWERARRIALARDDFRCADCEESERALLDVHHRVPRSAGGGDEPANLLTLCDGCHAARHPNLQVSLARVMIERWGMRLARWLDVQRQLPDEIAALPAALRLFGKERLREGQLDAVLAALRGESVLVVRPTGAGKTLCFQLPAVMRQGPTFVLSPLKALMKDQVAELQRRKLPATFINGDLGPAEKRGRYDLLQSGALKFLYCTPERFGDKVRTEEVAELVQSRPVFLVVDEAHCINRWGDDFRPDYGRIAEIRAALCDPPILAFTATAGRVMQGQILDSLRVPDATRLVTGADRPNIALVRHHLPYDARPGESAKEHAQMTAGAELIARLIANVEAGKAMVFVPTVKIGERLQSALRTRGLDLPFYHSGLGTANQRDLIIGRFTGRLEPPLDAVICTNAFGMGIDVPDVRLVVNWQHPASVEDYLQEFGRAGRDGEPALAVVLTSGDRDARLLTWMADKTIEKALVENRITSEVAADRRHAKHRQINTMNRLAVDQATCFRRALLDELVGPRMKQARTLARRLLDRIFSQRVSAKAAPFCCDACNPRAAARVLGFGRQAT